MNKGHIEFAKIEHVNFLSRTWNIKKDNIQLCFARDFLRNRIRRKRCETTKPIVNNICKTEHKNKTQFAMNTFMVIFQTALEANLAQRCKDKLIKKEKHDCKLQNKGLQNL